MENKLKFDTERFRNIAAGVQSAVLTLAVVIGGCWTLYTFGALHEIGRREAELKALEHSLTERGIPDINLLSEQMPGDSYHDRYLVVTVAITNRGNRTEMFDWTKGGLTAARTAVSKDSRQTIGTVLHAGYMLVDGLPASSTVLPGQTRRFPFLLGLDAVGLYHVQFSVQVSPLELPFAVREHVTVQQDTLVYTWTQTAYMNVR